MGTHPIFESDFDCLTDIDRKRTGKNTNVYSLEHETVGQSEPDLGRG